MRLNTGDETGEHLGMAALFGRISEFDPEREEWSQYAQRLTHFFAANGVEDETKKKEILLAMVGPATFKLLTNLVVPDTPGKKTYEELIAVLKTHHNPEPSEVIQRLQFYARDRKPGESVSMYVAELRSLAVYCNFGTTLDKMLRDRLVGGINDSRVRKRLLQEKDLNFKRALEIAQALEVAERDERKLEPEPVVQKLDSKPARNWRPVNQRKDDTGTPTYQKCYRCGKTNHKASNCRFKSAKCHNCGKTGHLKTVCQQPVKKDRRDSVKKLRDERDSQSPEEYTLFSLGEESSRKPFIVQLKIDDVSLSMELDTGASLSIMSKNTFRKHWPSRPLESTTRKLTTYTGETIDVLGTAQVQVTHGENSAELELMIVDMDGPSLLGRNWLNKLTLDWSTLHYLHDGPLGELLKKHSRLFREELGTLHGFQAKIHVNPHSVPMFCSARSVPYSMRPLVEEELEKLVSQGVIEPVTYSDWAAPIVPVLKADKKSVRICGDFSTTVNKASRLDNYPIPKVEDLFAKLQGGVVFTKLDMSQAYQQLSLDEESKQYVVVNTHKGLYRFNRLPFGVSSAPGIFQRAMESLLQDIPSVVVYIDDILITGATEAEHLQTLSKVLERLESAGLTLKKEKCVFASTSVTYLGHTIDRDGIHPTPDKVQAVQQASTPKNVTELKAFLGLLNYYGKFMPNLATTLKPLYNLLQESTKWRWNDKEKKAFEASKKLLLSSQVLTHYNPELQLVLACDASQYGLGAVLSQRYPNGEERPVGYASRTLSKAEQNYSQIEKEGLACVFGVKRFHCYIFGRSFILSSDHKPLASLFAKDKTVPAQASARIQRWALTLGMYEYELIHKSGATHGNADALSRLPLPGSASEETPQPAEMVLLFEELQKGPVTAEQIKLWTRRDPVLSRVQQFVLKGWPTGAIEKDLKPYWHKRLELSSHDGCLLWGNRVVVPAAGQASVLEELHIAHPGSSQMKQIARTMVWWSGIDKDIERTVQSCTTCQSQQNLPPAAPVQPWRWPTRPWARLHADFAGPIQGHMLLLLVDAHSKWIEVFPMSTITSTATIQSCRKLFATFGVPEVLVTDNGPSFVSAEFEQFLKKNSIRHKTSPPYHPATNGLAERAVQTVKKGLKKMKSGTLQDKLSRFLFRYRNTPQSTTEETPSQLLLGRKMRSPLDVIHPDLQRKVEEKQDKHVMQSNDIQGVETGDAVYARNFSRDKGTNPWLPGEVIELLGTRSILIKLSDGRTVRRHMDHVRKRLASPQFDWDTTPPPVTIPSPSDDAMSPPEDQVVIPPSDPTPTDPTPTDPPQRRYPVRKRGPPDWYIPN